MVCGGGFWVGYLHICNSWVVENSIIHNILKRFGALSILLPDWWILMPKITHKHDYQTFWVFFQLDNKPLSIHFIPLKNSQVAAVTSILGTNQLPNSVDIIENSASGTNYFAKVSQTSHITYHMYDTSHVMWMSHVTCNMSHVCNI